MIRVRIGLGSEEVFVFDSKNENMDRAVEAVQSVLGLGFPPSPSNSLRLPQGLPPAHRQSRGGPAPLRHSST